MPPTGRSPFGDTVPTFRVEVRADGVYVGVEPDRPHVRTVTDLTAETLVNWGVRHVFGLVGHSNPGLADALRRQEEAGRLTYIGIRVTRASELDDALRRAAAHDRPALVEVVTDPDLV